MRSGFTLLVLILFTALGVCAQGNAGYAIVGWWRIADGGGNLYASEDGKVIHELEEEETEGNWTNAGGRSYKLAYSDGVTGMVTVSPDANTLEGSTRASRFTVGAARPRETLSNSNIADMVKAGIHEDFILGLIQRHVPGYSFAREDLATLQKSGVSANLIAAMWKFKNWIAPLTDESLLKMVKDGLSDEIAASAIKQFSGVYSLLPDDLAGLRKSGVSESLIAAVHVKLGMPLELKPGAFRRNGDALALEKIEWDSPVSGHIQGTQSTVSVKIPQGCARPGLICDMKIPPTEFLIHAASPNEAANYQLARLHTVQDHREFHGHDGIHLESVKIADGTYLVSFYITTSAPSGMGPGEYGFLAPNGAMYTFRLTN
jgi:hypothetical protein